MISTLAYHYKFVNSYSINTFFLPKNEQFLLNVFIKLDIILTTHTHPYTHIDRYVNNHAVFINPIFKQYNIMQSLSTTLNFYYVISCYVGSWCKLLKIYQFSSYFFIVNIYLDFVMIRYYVNQNVSQ